MGSGDEQSKNDAWLSPSTVLVLCIGILVPIVAALIPAAIRHFTSHDFRYSITGPITVANRMAFAVTVRNRGRVVEKNVEVWLPKNRPDQVFEFEMSWAPPGSKVRDEANHKVVSLGDLKPDERARISVVTTAKPGAEASASTFRGEMLLPAMAPRIVSADRVAEWVPEGRRSSAIEYAYRIGFWGFVILVLTAILWVASASKFGRRLVKRD
ncbi:MAG TPA: hypothetical protein VN929_07290 [Burkholderiales bacterium]|nr:hypothetical protein [Burkholderiales bacterium]